MTLSIAGTAQAQALARESCESRAVRPAQTKAEAETISKLAPIKQCKQSVDDRTACNRFVGKALEILFANKDFKTGPNDYMLANDIANGLEQPGNAGWTKVGLATDQTALDAAQKFANEGRAVVAARLGRPKPGGGRGPGHVALVIPGTVESAKFEKGYDWGVLKAPNSASLFLDDGKVMFAGCPLSAVWKKPEEVKLFVK